MSGVKEKVLHPLLGGVHILHAPQLMDSLWMEIDSKILDSL